MSPNMTFRVFLPVVILAGFFQAANCQNGEAWTMTVSVIHNNYNSCSTGYSYAGSNTSVTFNGVTQNSSDGNPSYTAFFSHADGLITGAISISTAAKCKCFNSNYCTFNSEYINLITGTINVSHNPSADGNCRSISQTLTSGSYSAAVVITFFKTMNQPTIDSPQGFCENSTVTLSTVSTASASGYKWYVSENIGGPYYEIIGKTTQTITVSANDLDKTGFTRTTRYTKVADAGCGYQSASSNHFDIFLPPPTSTSVAWGDPKCFQYDNGHVTINSVTGQVSNYMFTLKYDDGTGYATVYQEPFATSALPVSIDKAKILGDGLSPHGIKAGKWRLDIANNVSITTLGSCSVSEDKNIVEPTKVNATLTGSDSNPAYNGKGVKCNGDNNGSVSVSASGGTPGYTYLWSNSTTGTSISNLTAGTYSVIVTDANGCTASRAHTLVAPDPLTVGIATTKAPSCAESLDGQMTATPSGGVPTYTYLWSNTSTNALATGLAENTYSVTVTDRNGCTASQSSFLDAPLPIVVTLDGTPPTCANGDNGRVWVTRVQNQPSSTLQYVWNTGDNTFEALNLPEGSYTVTVSSANGSVTCTGTASKGISDPASWSATISPVLAYNGSAIKCNGEANGRLDVTLKNNLNQIVNGDYYTWSTGDNGASVKFIDQIGEGGYTVNVRYNSICETQASYTLNDPEPITAIITTSSNYNGRAITCPGNSDGSLHATGSGGTGSLYTFVWDNGVTGANITGKPAGTYTVVATDVNGCSGPGERTLSDPPLINPQIDITSNYNGLSLKCHDSTDAKLHASSTGGAGTISYVWNTTATGSDLNDVGAGNYSLIATDANGCIMSASKSVINPEPVVASIAIVSDFNGQAISCHNASDGVLRASGTGGTSSFGYSWNTGTSGSNLSGVPAGSYAVTVTDMNGCTDTETEIVMNPTQVQAIITNYSNYNGYGVRCKNSLDGFVETAGQGGTGNYTLLWLETLETTPTSTNLPAGTYTIKVTDTNGCFNTNFHTVTEPTALTISLSGSNNILCFDGEDGELQVTASGGVTSYQYSINSVTTWQTSSEFKTLKAATPYTITVKDFNGCTKSLTETLSQPTHLDVSFETESAFCADPRGKATATVTGGVGNYTYEWKNTAASIISTTSVIMEKPAGVYSLLVHDANNCPLLKDVAITSTDGPQVSIAETVPAKCSYSSDGSAILEVVAGDQPFTYLWPNGQTTIQGAGLGKGIYNVTITDKNNCISIKEVQISAPEVLKVALSESTNPACYGDCNGKIKVVTTGGTAPYGYRWNDQPGTNEASNICMGDHTVKVRDNHGCITSQTYTLLQPELLQVQVKERKLPLCFGDCNGSIEVTASGGNGNYQFAWTSGSSQALAPDLCAGQHTVKVTDSKSCLLQRTISLGQPEQLQVRLKKNQAPICNNGCDGELTVEAFGGTASYTYQWSTGSGSANLIALCSADYRVNITDVNGCAISSTYNVENPPALILDLGEGKTLCVGQTYVLDAGPSWTKYTWSSNTGISGNTSRIVIKDPGQYSVEVENQDGCKTSDTFILETSLDLLQAEFFMSTKAMVGDTIVMTDVSWPLPEKIVWHYPASMVKIFANGPVVYGQFNDPGVYEVTLTAALGECRDKMIKSISILKDAAEPDGGRLGYQEFVINFELYPNPNFGVFDVNVKFSEESPITLSVWSLTTSLNMGTWRDSGRSSYQKHVDLRPLGSGTYVLRLDHAKGYKTIRFVVH
jgi:hypothetical protein